MYTVYSTVKQCVHSTTVQCTVPCVQFVKLSTVVNMESTVPGVQFVRLSTVVNMQSTASQSAYLWCRLIDEYFMVDIIL